MRSAASHRGSSSSAIGDTATQELNCQPTLIRHDASMTQDGLQIADEAFQAATPTTGGSIIENESVVVPPPQPSLYYHVSQTRWRFV